MATESQFPKAPPLRFELTPEQVADLEKAKPPGAVALVVGYAERHRWPEPERFSLCAWFVEMPEAEAALMAGGIMATVKHRPKGKGKRTPKR
jgi:hypothetical protein